MDFEPTEHDLAATELGRRFALEALPTLPPDAPAFVHAAVLALGARGFFALPSLAAAVAAAMSLSRASASLGALFANGWLFADALARHGAKATASYDAASRGALIGAVGVNGFGAAEPNRRLRVDGAAITGTVSSVVLGGLAAHALVATDPDGHLLTLVDLSHPLVTRGASVSASGLARAPRAALTFDAVPLSACAGLAEGTSAGVAVQHIRNAERILTAALAVGLAQRATEDAARRVRGAAVRPRQSTEFVISDMATLLDAATLSTQNAAWLRDEGSSHTLESANAKLVATRAAVQIVHGALGIAGEAEDAEGLRRAHLDARYLEMRDGPAAQVDTIAGILLSE